MLNDVKYIIESAFYESLAYFNSPNKRIYYVYLLSSGVLALLVYFSKKRKYSIVHYLFNKKTWLSQSAKTDYLFIVFNAFVKVLLIAPMLIISLRIAFYVHQYLLDTFGYASVQWSKTALISLYTFSVFIVNDFSSYVLHCLQHRIEFLWRFHKVHHSAIYLNPFTQYRIHPVELIMNNIKNIVLMGFLFGVFEYVANERLSAHTILGVNVLNFLFLFLGANLRHSHIKLKYPHWVEHIFISPVQHQIHHSDNPKHFNKNYGAKLAIWDWLFGSIVFSKQSGKLKYGLGKEENARFKSFWQNLWQPFRFLK